MAFGAKAMSHSCLQHALCFIHTPNKVDRLLKEIPEANLWPVAAVGTPESKRLISRSPVSAPPHDGSLGPGLDVAAMNAKLQALELADAKRQTELEALKSEKETLLRKVSRKQHHLPAVFCPVLSQRFPWVVPVLLVRRSTRMSHLFMLIQYNYMLIRTTSEFSKLGGLLGEAYP